jgi:hypothetical protein
MGLCNVSFISENSETQANRNLSRFLILNKKEIMFPRKGD